jgi:hypothetical protein
MDRPPLEVADIVRAAGDTFIEKTARARWMRQRRWHRRRAAGGHLDECTAAGIAYLF